MKALRGAPPAVIVGFELNGLGVSRALAPHGVECLAIGGPSPHPAWKTRTCRVMPCPTWSQEGVVRQLRQIGQRHRSHTGRLPLLITMEQPVRWISEARSELVEWYEICLPDAPVVDLLMHKGAFERRCTREGWPVPRTWSIGSRQALLGVLGEVSFPCILKPALKSRAFANRSPRKAFKAADAQDLIDAYLLASQWTDGFVLQEWIPGGDERIAFCLTYVDRDGNPRAVFPGRKLRQWPPECGNTALCEQAPAAWGDGIRVLTERIWTRVGFKGLGSMEYKMRPDGGGPVIMEPTVGRTNYQNEIAVLNGVNIPLIAYCDLAGLPPPRPAPATDSCKLVDGVRELRAARHYFRGGALTYRRWLQDRRGRVRFMTLRAGDPLPLLASLVSTARIAVHALGGILVERLFGRATKERLKAAMDVTRP